MEKVKKIVLIGASGFVGSALLNEALNRDLEVTAVVRHPEKIKIENENLKVVKADVSALDEVTAVCKGADAVISAFNPGWNNPDIYDETIKVYLTIIDGVKKAGVNRFLMVGGAGSLFIAPGLRLMDSGEVPENILPSESSRRVLSELFKERKGNRLGIFLSGSGYASGSTYRTLSVGKR